MKHFKAAWKVLKQKGLIGLVGEGTKFIVLRTPGGYTLLTWLRDRLHPKNKTQKLSPPSGGTPCTDTACPTYPYVDTDIEPFDLKPAGTNPILSHKDVSDYTHCEFVADPFLFISGDGTWHVFFESYSSKKDGVISHASSPDSGQTWKYNGIILNEEVHLSFPYVFKWDKNYYLVPEKGAAEGRTVELYKAREFPDHWDRAETLVTVEHRTDDSVLFRWNEMWWILIGDRVEQGLHAYYSDTLEKGTWTPHEHNPIITNRPEGMRPAGRPIVRKDRIILFLQDCRQQYGNKVNAYEITELGPTTYTDRRLFDEPILEGVGGRGWNSGRMHHIDPWYLDGQWWCVVDGGIGLGKHLLGDGFSIGLYVSDHSEAEIDHNDAAENESTR